MTREPWSRDPLVWEDDKVVAWREMLASGNKKVYSFALWLHWLRGDDGVATNAPGSKRKVGKAENGLCLPEATPTGLICELENQRDIKFARDLARSVDDFVRLTGGTRNSMTSLRADIRSFFRCHQLALPDTVFRFQPTKESASSRLDVSIVKRVVEASNLRDRAVYLSIWMGLMDENRFCQFNNKMGYELGQHIINVGVDVPFKVEFSGRKENLKKFYTFIGRDALTGWKQYFERERDGGYPKRGEPAALKNNWKTKSTDYRPNGLRTIYMNMLRDRLGVLPASNGELAFRSGMNLHEWRDTAKTFVRTMYKKTGFIVEGRQIDFDSLSIEFFMGHKVDPLNYDKFYNDQLYTRLQYRIIEQRLNIISNDPKVEDVRRESEGRLEAYKGLEDRLARMELDFAAYRSDVERYINGKNREALGS